VHGFIQLNEWERDIVNHPCFQRLRRIRQLAWTEMVYPGTTHTRFGHSLGVMHIATRIYDSLVARCSSILIDELKFTKDALAGRQRQLLRIAALLHDVGHAPFSHAGEELMPFCGDDYRYTHEDYTIGIIKYLMRDVIDGHPYNKQNYGLTVQDVTDFFRDTPDAKNLIWRQIVSSQLDADRMDYMLRDSHYAGVEYGRYDLNRIIATISMFELPDNSGFSIGIDEDGIHAAEGLLIARYMLFTQVYFHKTRIIYDYHLQNILKDLLKDKNGCFPSPDSVENVQRYVDWDDWCVYGELHQGGGGRHGQLVSNRNHYRLLKETHEVPELEELELIDSLENDLKSHGIDCARITPEKSWYKTDSSSELYVQRGKTSVGPKVMPLSAMSKVINGLAPVRQNKIYVPEEQRSMAYDILMKYNGKQEGRHDG
jgi:HD superfamily phosphohydrolase